MFTGIVEGTGTIAHVKEDDDGRRLRIETDIDDTFSTGQSISVSGVCLTVEAHSPESFTVFVATETAARSYLGTLAPGDTVHLERALRADDRFDGHVVQGHVDTTTEVVAVDSVGEDWRFSFEMPDGYEGYIATKGSIAIDGVSLTVAGIDDAAGTFDVAVIPSTYELTRLSELAPGDPVHVEVDVLAKYVARLLETTEMAAPPLGRD